MIDATCELDYLWRGLRALVSFRLATAKAWARHGHVVRRRAIDAYLAGHAERKLHLSATHDVPGFLNSQICGAVPIDITRPLPLPDGSFDRIYSSHLVEHIHRRQLAEFLAEARRVLQPGGSMIIATPSLGTIVPALWGDDDDKRTLLLERTRKHSWEGFHGRAQALNTVMRAFGHRWLVDVDYLRGAGLRAGFSAVDSIGNLDLPDPELVRYIRDHKPAAWFVETETFLLKV